MFYVKHSNRVFWRALSIIHLQRYPVGRCLLFYVCFAGLDTVMKIPSVGSSIQEVWYTKRFTKNFFLIFLSSPWFNVIFKYYSTKKNWSTLECKIYSICKYRVDRWKMRICICFQMYYVHAGYDIDQPILVFVMCVAVFKA